MATKPPKTKSSGAESFGRLPAAAKAGIGIGLLAVIGAVYYFALHMSLNEELSSAQAREVTLQQEMQSARARNAEYVSCWSVTSPTASPAGA